MGVAVGFLFVPMMAELLDAVVEKENLPNSNDTVLNDKASGMMSLFSGVGVIIAPILGGEINFLYGFRHTCDFMAILGITVAILYFSIRILPELIESHMKKKKLNQ